MSNDPRDPQIESDERPDYLQEEPLPPGSWVLGLCFELFNAPEQAEIEAEAER